MQLATEAECFNYYGQKNKNWWDIKIDVHYRLF